MYDPDPMEDISLDDWGYGDVQGDLESLSE